MYLISASSVVRSYRAWGQIREVEGERIGMRSKLLKQLLLHRCQFHFGVDHRHDLVLPYHHLLGKLQSHHFIFLPTVAVRRNKLNKNTLIALE